MEVPNFFGAIYLLKMTCRIHTASGVVPQNAIVAMIVENNRIANIPVLVAIVANARGRTIQPVHSVDRLPDRGQIQAHCDCEDDNQDVQNPGDYGEKYGGEDGTDSSEKVIFRREFIRFYAGLTCFPP